MDRTDFYEQLQAGVPRILAYLEQVAGIFALPFQADDYHFISLTAQQKVLLDFLAGCPGLPHSKWGESEAGRREQLADFVQSADFQDYSAQLSSGGSVLESKIAETLATCCQAADLPAWVHGLSESLSQEPALQQDFFVAICLQEPSEAQLRKLHGLLVHEWSHLLFFSNGIKFQTTAADHADAWLFDEGLATWIEYAYKAGQWDCRPLLEKSFEILQERGQPRSLTGYFEKGLWFNAYFAKIDGTAWAEALKTLAQRLPAMVA